MHALWPMGLRAGVLEQESGTLRQLRPGPRSGDGRRAGRGSEGAGAGEGPPGELAEGSKGRSGLRGGLSLLRCEDSGRKILQRMRSHASGEDEVLPLRPRGGRSAEVLPGVRREILRVLSPE